MVVVLGGIGVHVLEIRAKAHAQEEVRYTAAFITEKIRVSVDGAHTILTPSMNATGTVLTLQMHDPEKNPTVFDSVDGQVRMQEGSGSPAVLSVDGVVPTLEFSNVTQEDGPGSIRYILHLESYNPEQRIALSASSTFYTTVSIRTTP